MDFAILVLVLLALPAGLILHAKRQNVHGASRTMHVTGVETDAPRILPVETPAKLSINGAEIEEASHRADSPIVAENR